MLLASRDGEEISEASIAGAQRGGEERGSLGSKYSRNQTKKTLEAGRGLWSLYEEQCKAISVACFLHFSKLIEHPVL